jgi:hypothetical protein
MAQISYVEYTGKGLHSEDNVARLKPALKKWMGQYVLPPFFRLLRLFAKYLVKGTTFLPRLILRMQAF